jgi:tetratricopeptide (TPR) repeat protein
MKTNILITLSLIGFMSCSTQHLTSKVQDEKRDTFREESFLRYTEDRLDKLGNTPYKSLAKCHNDEVNEGLKELQHQTHEKKKDPEFWNQIGMCYFLANHLVKAEYYFQFSLDLDKKKRYAPALNNLGTIKLKQGHYEMALDYFKKAAEFKKGERNLKVPLFNQAQVYLQFNLLQNAQTILEALNHENREDPDILLSLGSVYLMQGNTQKSLDILQKIPKRYQDREDVTLIRALGLYENKKIYEVYELLKEYDFTQYVPLKNSAKKLKELVTLEVKKLEELKKKEEEAQEKLKNNQEKKAETQIAHNSKSVAQKDN